MAVRDRSIATGIVLATAALALLWPLSAYVAGPILFPAALAGAAAALLVIARPEYGIALALALAPLTNAPLGGVEPFQFLIPAIAAGVLTYGMLVSRESAGGPATRRAGIAMAILGLVALLASAQAIDPSASLNKLVLIASAVALFFAVRRTCTEPRQLVVVVSGALAGLLVAAAHGLVQQQLGVFSTEGFVAGGEVVGRIQGAFGHPNFFGAFLALLIPLAVAVTATREFTRGIRWLALVGLALAVPALVLTYARGAIIGLILGAAIWFAFLRPRLAVGVAVLTIGAAVLLAPASLKERFDPGESGTDIALRSDIWSSAVAIYAERPILGTGLNNFALAYQELPSTTLNAAQRRLLHNDMLLVPPHPQSIYLQALAEEGLVGLIALLLFAALIVSVLLPASRARDPVGRAVAVATGMGFAGVLIHGFLEVPLFSELALPLFALIAVAATYADRDELA